MAGEEGSRRPSLTTADELKKKGSQLQKATTKEYSDEPTEEEVVAIKQIYDEKSSDLAGLAAHFKLDEKLLSENPPEDVAKFAKHMFAGLYTLDKTEAAKDALRQNLNDIKSARRGLRKSITRESTGPSTDDIAAAAKIYADHKGDLAKIAEQFGLKEGLMNNDPPNNANEFAEKFLAGNYSEVADEVAKQKLRETLRPDLMQRRPSLKKTTTKEYEGLSEKDPDFVMALKLFPGDNQKELEALAGKLGLSMSHLQSNPAKDAKDFAQKLLVGAYAADQAEMVKKQLRSKLEAAIRERRPSLSSVPKEKRRLSQVTDEEFQSFGSFFNKHDGDVDKIAEASGLPSDLLRSAPPQNPVDFVAKLMDGLYTYDMDEQAKQDFRSCLRKEVKSSKDKLKKTPTKEWDGSANEEDIKMFAKVYTARSGELKVLADLFSLDIDAMHLNPPENDQDFGKKVLLGAYTPDRVSKRVDEFRQSLSSQMKKHGGRDSLKPTETRQSSVQPSPGQIAKVAKIYNDLKGDLAQACQAVGADYAAAAKNKPADANDFAVKVLSGAYSTLDSETSRRRLSLVLHQDMLNHPALKQTTTKEQLSGPSAQDIAQYALLFDEHAGDLQKLAAVTQCDLELLKADAPKDGSKFAQAFLAGGYQRS